MIARIWRGTTDASKGEEYVDYLEATGLREYRETPGNRGALVLRRYVDGKAEFVLVTFWESFDAVRAFAGPDFGKAVYYPKDKDFLHEFEPHVEHYEVVETPSSTDLGGKG